MTVYLKILITIWKQRRTNPTIAAKMSTSVAAEENAEIKFNKCHQEERKKS